jgi:hypothetical protein
VIDSHQDEQHGERDDEVNESRQDRSQRDREAREVHLGEQVGAAYQARSGPLQSRSEQLPGEQAGEDEDRIGAPLRGHLDETAEDDREDDHGQHRLHHGPAHAQHGLLVADQDLLPGEKEQELAIAPEFA